MIICAVLLIKSKFKSKGHLLVLEHFVGRETDEYKEITLSISKPLFAKDILRNDKILSTDIYDILI